MRPKRPDLIHLRFDARTYDAETGRPTAKDGKTACDTYQKVWRRAQQVVDAVDHAHTSTICIFGHKFCQIAIWLNFGDLIEGVVHGDARGGDNFLAQRDYVRRQIETADAIVVDDIGRNVKYTDVTRSAQQDVLFRVMDPAIGSHVPTVLVSNLHYDALRGVVGSGAGRLRLDGPYWIVASITDPDMRKPQGAA